MKKSFFKAIGLISICIVFISNVSCQSSNDKNKEHIVETVSTTELSTSKSESEVFTDSEGNKFINMIVTDEKGDTVTDAEQKPVTVAVVVDQDGIPVTDEKGETKIISPIKKTTDINTTKITTISSSSEASSSNSSENNNNSKYYRLLWIGNSEKDVVSQDGQIATITFKIKETAKNGDYVIGFESNKPEAMEFVQWNLETVNTTPISGVISVGAKEAIAQNIPSSGFTVSITNGFGNVGETVTVYMEVKNNPGYFSFMRDFKYDSSALELQSVVPSGIMANANFQSSEY